MTELDKPRNPLNRDDLYLLLDSYKNSVELSTVIMEQLRQIMDLQSQFTSEERDVSQKQKEIYEKLTEIMSLIKENLGEIKSYNDKVFGKLETVEKDLSSIKLENTGFFEKVGNRINLVYVGLGTLCASLIGVIYILLEKLHILAEIAKSLGIGSIKP